MKKLLYILIQKDIDDLTRQNIVFIADSEKKCHAKAIALFKEWTGEKTTWKHLYNQDEFDIQGIFRSQTNIGGLKIK